MTITKKESSVEKSDVKRRTGILSKAVVTLSKSSDKKNYRKTQEDENLIKSVLRKNDLLLKYLDGDRFQKCIDFMYVRNTKPGQTIISKGDYGSHMYITAKGTYEIVRHDKTEIINNAQIIDEVSILYKTQKNFTMKSLSEGYLWILDCEAFQIYLKKLLITDLQEKIKCIKRIAKFQKFSEADQYDLAEIMEEQKYSAGTKINNQNKNIFVIKSGSVTVKNVNLNIINTLKRGDHFGDFVINQLEFLYFADTPSVECYILLYDKYIKHFGLTQESSTLNCTNTDFYNNITLNDLTILNTIGVGGYGKVDLVQYTLDKKQVFALKSMKKLEIISATQREQVFNEKNLQLSCDCTFIVKLFRTFRDDYNIYFLLEFCGGGDLWHLMYKRMSHPLNEPTAKFYAACILEALCYLHKNNIIYRDLKPENVVINSNGYVKLTDFGFAKKVKSKDDTNTYVGTPEYLAPEIVLHKPHNRAVDYWAFGVFIYELLARQTPFKHSKIMVVYKRITQGIENVQFSRHVSKTAEHLIKKLCKIDPSGRLGYQNNGFNTIQKHKWFENFQWDNLRKQQLKAPYKPDLENHTDTNYFSNFQKDVGKIPTNKSNTTWDIHF